jgi:hypothetical protein
MSNLIMENKIDITDLINAFVKKVELELKDRWNNWDINLSKSAQFEVIGGILARQASLAIQIAQNINIWNEEIAPILLRSMADNHINLAWILTSPEENSKSFIAHGIGQMKLQLEHFKLINDKEPSLQLEEEIEHLESFINSQKFTFLAEVNLGSWSGLNTRKLAEEAGILDFYNHVYQPFSGCAHSTWTHISKYNTSVSNNPLHKFLRKPLIPDLKPDIFYFHLASKYWFKSISTFDNQYEYKSELEYTFHYVDEVLSHLNEDEETK